MNKLSISQIFSLAGVLLALTACDPISVVRNATQKTTETSIVSESTPDPNATPTTEAAQADQNTVQQPTALPSTPANAATVDPAMQQQATQGQVESVYVDQGQASEAPAANANSSSFSRDGVTVTYYPATGGCGKITVMRGDKDITHETSVVNWACLPGNATLKQAPNGMIYLQSSIGQFNIW